MSSMVATQKDQLPALSMSEDDLIEVLQNSLYPGAKKSSVKLVIEYCKASVLDPMQKPVHIVPMWDKQARENRDVIMPGIGLYRIQAARSGEYAGVSEPEYGETATEDLSGVSVQYPVWCKVVVRRSLKNGIIAEFSAKELWKENYATAGKDSSAPNAMWKKRPYAQLAKCAEAQALRKAFPEIGSQPTADEMEGKYFEESYTPADVVKQEPTKQEYPAENFNKTFPAWEKLILSGKKTVEDIVSNLEKNSNFFLTEAQIDAIKTIKKPTVTYAQIAEQLNNAVDSDALDAAADLIGEITDQQQRKELGDIYNSIRIKFEGK